MAHVLEIPDPVYMALESAAEASGKTPVEWIAEQVTKGRSTARTTPRQSAAATSLADLMEGRLGRVHSGGEERLSEACGERFTEHLVDKRREGNL